MNSLFYASSREGEIDTGVLQVICHPQQCKSPGQPRLNDLALLKLAMLV